MKAEYQFSILPKLVVLISCILFLSQCMFFSNREVKTSFIDSSKREYIVTYSPGNAVTNSAIVIKREFGKVPHQNVAVFESYTDFILLEKMADDSISIGVWSDIGNYPGRIKTKIDTFKIDLKSDEVFRAER